ncbi:glycosyltransferase family 2 protein [Desulfovibrio sp.]|uniref:glycosyltransferase family 2 protein n=1 Tax=Desulfovibrio sp. TaxID=885 RepID=UPI0025C0EDCD|nr:glycosyltransferase family 2 protein [Desulfovibrio sp.]
MRAHIGVVCWNRLELTRLCLTSLLQKTPPGYGLTVVDNGSTDGTKEFLQSLASAHPHMRLHLLRRNMGVAVASNLAWDDAADADFYVKLDNDVEVLDPQWLNRLMRMLTDNPRLGMVGYKLCAKHEGTPLTLADGSPSLEVICCNGACACIPHAVHELLGFWNEGFGRYGYEDLEYSWRARRAGYTLAYAPQQDALRHHGTEPEFIDPEQERGKLSSHTSDISGTKAYLLYLLLYEQGVIPLKMGRKYLPSQAPEGLTFSLNPAHKALQRLMVRLINSVDTSQQGDLSQLDLRAWQNKGNPA